MTRETKIGLLVGLAFIIVIGILLSDHLTSSTEPPQAALANAGNGVRQGVNSPGTGGLGAPVVVVPPAVVPTQTVATQHELTPPPVIVKIGGPTTPANVPTPVTPVADNTHPDQPPVDPTPAKANDPAPVAVNDQPTKPAPVTDTELTRVAQAHGEELVSAGGTSDTVKGKPVEYTAQAGDSVSKIAAKFLGSSSKTNVDLFVKSNPSLKGDPTKLMAGKTYQIPAPAAAKTAPLTPVASNEHDADDAVAAKSTTPAPAEATPVMPVELKAVKTSGSDLIYIVKPGDNLTKIAREQVGDVHAIAAIQELNKDTLKGAKKDVVIVGTKLRLPGKAVARAE